MFYLAVCCCALLLGACSPAPASPAAAAPQAVAANPAAPDTLPLPPGYNLAYLTGQFDPATHPDFVKVSGDYTDRSDFYLHRDAYAAFERMHAAAAREGISLKVISATRNFARQKEIWEAKWTGARTLEAGEKAPQAYPDPAQRALAILRYSSMPGTSRHHWGTDLDLVNLTNEYFATGQGLRIYTWLRAHAAEYGFCQPYSPKGPERPNGYYEEKWHWSYLPLAQPLTALAQRHLHNTHISGFLGAEVAPAIQVVENYVLGINPQCLP